MFRFTDLIKADELVEDVVARYPVTRTVFEASGVRRSCWNCSIRTAAKRAEVDVFALLEQLNRAVFGPRAGQAER